MGASTSFCHFIKGSSCSDFLFASLSGGALPGRGLLSGRESAYRGADSCLLELALIGKVTNKKTGVLLPLRLHPFPFNVKLARVLNRLFCYDGTDNVFCTYIVFNSNACLVSWLSQLSVFNCIVLFICPSGPTVL